MIYSDHMPSTMDSDLSEWIKLLSKLEAIQLKVVVPGHGRVTDAKGVIRLKILLQAFRAAVQKGYEEGLADYEMMDSAIETLAEFEQQYPSLAEKVRRDISSVCL